MEDRLRAIAAKFGVFLTREAKALGYDDNAITRHHQSGVWVRVRHGAYTFPEIWAAADERDKHRLLARAAYRTSRVPVAMSHISRVAELTDRLWNLPLDEAHLTRLDGKTGRREAGVCPHRGQLTREDLEMEEGFLMTTATRAALDLATIAPAEPTLVAWDGLLASKATTLELMQSRYSQGMEGNPDTLHVPRLFSLCDPKSGSVGETRFCWLCHSQGLPRPQTQQSVYGLGGALLGITDFFWEEEQTYGEFDGLVKYHRYRRPHETIEQAVIREKKREDDIRGATGAKFIRYVWLDLENPAQTRERTLAVLRAPYFRVHIPLSS